MNIQDEIKFLEAWMETTRTYIQENPMNQLTDRMIERPTGPGGRPIPTVVASIEQQARFLQETMNRYAEMLVTLDELRKKS